MKSNQSKTSCKQGFTLIELLIVVLIIGILAAVAVPQYRKAVVKSRITQVLPFIRAVYEAQKVYYLANGEYAESVEDLDIDYTCPTGWSCNMGGNAGISAGTKPKVEAFLSDEIPLSIFMYYDSTIIDSQEMEGKLVCWARSSSSLAVSACRSFGPDFGSTSTGIMVSI